MNVPLVSLSQSVMSIPVSDGVDSYACALNSLSSSIATHGLTVEQVAVIKAYTSSCGLYKILNAALRSEEYTRIQPWFTYLKLFQLSVTKIHPNKGTFCRGIPDNVESAYKVGTIMTWVH